MGYSGLSCVCDSDTASDLAYGAVSAMAEALRKDLKTKESMWNTDGCVNVALFIEELIGKKASDIPTFLISNDDLVQLAKDDLELIQKKHERAKKVECDNEESKKMHLKAYERMIKSLERFLDQTR